MRHTKGLVPLCSLTSSPSCSVKWTQPARGVICHPCSPAAAAARLVLQWTVRHWHVVFGQCLHSSEKLLFIRVQPPCHYSQSEQRECKEMPGNSALRLHCSFQGCLVTQQHTGRGPSTAPSFAKAARGSTTTVTQLQPTRGQPEHPALGTERQSGAGWPSLCTVVCSVAPSLTAVRVSGQGEGRAGPQGH